MNRFLVGVVTLLGCTGASAAPLAFRLDSATLCVGKGSPQAHEDRCQRRVSDKNIDTTVRRILANAELLEPLFVMKHTHGTDLVFLASEPSNPNRRTGYCGAGTEDRVVLLRYAGGRIRHRDTFLLQSCRQSLLLESGTAQDLLDRVDVDRRTQTIRFRWETEATERRLSVRAGRFRLD